MALFSSSLHPPILYHKVGRNYAIHRPSTCTVSKISKIPSKTPNIAVCCSSLNSHVELEEEPPPSSVIIFVKGLPQSAGEGGLKEAFSRYGKVSHVKMLLDKKTKQPLGFAYVWFTREDDAETAVEEMNGQFFEGRFIHVTIANPGSCKSRPKSSSYKF